jgi:hypothetical protein
MVDNTEDIYDLAVNKILPQLPDWHLTHLIEEIRVVQEERESELIIAYAEKQKAAKKEEVENLATDEEIKRFEAMTRKDREEAYNLVRSRVGRGAMTSIKDMLKAHDDLAKASSDVR